MMKPAVLVFLLERVVVDSCHQGVLGEECSERSPGVQKRTFMADSYLGKTK